MMDLTHIFSSQYIYVFEKKKITMKENSRKNAKKVLKCSNTKRGAITYSHHELSLWTLD